MSKKKLKGETTAEWYERITGQRIGSLKEGSSATINGVSRPVNG